MSSIAWSNVIDHAPGLVSVDVDLQTDVLAYVNTYVVPGNFGGDDSPQLKLARIYLAAHLATMATQANVGQTGPVQSESAGGLSRSYAVAQFASGSSMGDTSWGRAFAAIARVSPSRALVVL